MIAFAGVWWVWMALALVLALAEVLLPGFIFLGFAVGALIMTGVVVVFSDLTPPALLAIFALLSLLSWIGLRQVFKKQSSGARIVTDDVNDN